MFGSWFGTLGFPCTNVNFSELKFLHQNYEVTLLPPKSLVMVQGSAYTESSISQLSKMVQYIRSLAYHNTVMAESLVDHAGCSGLC